MVRGADPGKLRAQGERLMELSSQLRRARNQLDALAGALRQNENLQEVRRKLEMDTNNLTMEMARLAALSSALQQIASLYERCEAQNADTMDAVRPRGQRTYAVTVQPVDPNIYGALR